MWTYDNTIDWDNGRWHVAYIVWIPLLSILAILCLVAMGWCIYKRATSRYSSDWGIGVISFGIIALICGGLAIWGAFPWDTTYHKYYHVTGQVEQIGSRQVASEKAMYTRYVFTIKGKPFGVDDTRASLVKPGDNVSLQCSRDYQYAGAPGWVCEWGEQQ